MELRIQSTGQVMYESEYRAWLLANNGPSFDQLTPEVMAELGIDPVLEGPQATGGDRYQYSQRDGVEQINGQWFTKYILGPVFQNYFDENNILHTAEEQEAAYKAQKDAEQATVVRKQRNTLLADWVDRMNPLVWEVMTDEAKQDYRNYRQALLDVPNQTGFPWDVQWPETPTELAKKN